MWFLGIFFFLNQYHVFVSLTQSVNLESGIWKEWSENEEITKNIPMPWKSGGCVVCSARSWAGCGCRRGMSVKLVELFILLLDIFRRVYL